MPATTVPATTAAKTSSPARPLVPLVPLPVAVLASAIAGAVMVLASPAIGWWPLTFVSVTLLLSALVGRSATVAALLGFTYGAVFYGLLLAWVGVFLGPLPRIALTTLEALLSGIGAVLIALAYRWTARKPRRSFTQMILVPLLIGGLWTTGELLAGSWPYGGFPWARLGMTQVNGPLAEVASWTGVTGLSFLCAVIAAAVLQWLRGGGLRFRLGLLPAIVLVGILIVTPQFPTTSNGTFRIGWVQGNGPAGYFDRKQQGDLLAGQTAASTPLFGRPMDLLVWPEGSVDSDPLRNPATQTVLNQISSAAGAPLLANAATIRNGQTFNTSMLWTPDQVSPQLYDKRNPVPFGEYVPDRWLYGKLAPDLVGLIQREYTPGRTPSVVTVGNTTIGLAICFDVIFDPVLWDGARNGAQVYVFQTNNADFRGTDENLQQLAFARMRAIETGRSVINISTAGTSQAIDPTGKTIATAPAGAASAKLTTVNLRTGLTPAVILGPWLSLLIPCGTIAALIVTATRSHRRPSLPTRLISSS